MNEVSFLKNFKNVANAHEGVQRLRELVLQLAATGRLVPRVAREGDSKSLIAAIYDERERLSDEGEVRFTSPLPDVETSSQSLSVPGHWYWIRLGNLTSKIGSGSTPRGGSKVYVNDGIPFLRSQNILNDGVRLDDVVFISAETHAKMRNTQVIPNDILLNITGASLGRCAIAPADFPAANVSQHVTIIRPLLTETRNFLKICLLSPFGQGMIWGRQVGMAREGLSKKVLEQFEIPLPPLAEQKRIVAKVDELMRLCDRLETHQQERGKLLPLLSRANHARFVAEPTDASLRSIFLESGAVQTNDLWDTVLSLAYQGTLVSRLPEEGTGNDLLELMISDYLSKRGKEGQVKIGKTIVDPRACPSVFTVPKHWAWTYLDVACDLIADVDHNMPKAVPNGVPFISAKDLKDDGTIDFTSPKLISEADFERLSRKVKIRRDDIVYSRIGARLGKARLVAVDTRFLISYSCCLIRPKHELIDKHYLQLFLDSSLALSQAHKGAQSIGVPDLGLGEIKAFRIPLPPVLEQRRIVARILYMMLHVKRLEKLGTDHLGLGSAFAKAAVANITSTEFTENDRMKPPKTEVVTALKVGHKRNQPDAAPLAALLSERNAEVSAKLLWQLSGLDVDVFYRQLKTEMANGWIEEDTTKRSVKEVEIS